MTPFRIGHGFDVHALVVGRKLIIGGVEIAFERGLLGHSDADVLLHAICDALLGALALGDIGMHFPNNDAAYKDIDSKILLERCYRLIAGKGYKVVNVDSSICLENPKIKKYSPEMARIIAEILHVEPTDISIKATTTEKMGFAGREEGLFAYANVLLKKVSG